MTGKTSKVILLISVLLSFLVFIFSGFGIAQNEGLTPIEQLGELLYFDENLSQPAGQSCASCHLPPTFVDPDSDLPVSAGILPGRFGGRNSPSSAYAMYAPIRHIDGEGLYVGGQFWDSRATGEVLGDPLADQALGPFLNPVEMANRVKKQVIKDIRKSDYADLFEDVWGRGIFKNVEAAYDCVALSIAAFERTALFGQFSSKYDYYLKTCIEDGGDKDACAIGAGPEATAAKNGIFSKEEWAGFQLFMGENDNDGILEEGEGAFCIACHVVDWTPDPGNVVVPDWSPDGLVPPMFTDFTYDNLGVPKSNHPLLEDNRVDLGLGSVVGDPVTGDPDQNGKFKVMTLRNIGLTAPYAHNGFFESLLDITHFYNTRDVPEENWPAPEVPANVNDGELGNLGLSEEDEANLVLFMKTLSDGYTP
jgi:cytochrome c peroxidase